MQIKHLRDIPAIGITHNPDIKKKVMITSGEIPSLTTFATALFKPGQYVTEHAHATMYEVFLIQSGRALFTISGKVIEVSEGDCISIAPGELHYQSNPFDEDVSWIYFGIAI